jgi:hypothetical protein
LSACLASGRCALMNTASESCQSHCAASAACISNQPSIAKGQLNWNSSPQSHPHIMFSGRVACKSRKYDATLMIGDDCMYNVQLNAKVLNTESDRMFFSANDQLSKHTAFTSLFSWLGMNAG